MVCKKFPTDELGIEIFIDIAFADILQALNYGDDIYNTIGVEDSIIRERIFQEMADIMNVEYDVIYNLWLNN